jgi:hypothetical protein
MEYEQGMQSSSETTVSFGGALVEHGAPVMVDLYRQYE